MGKTFSTGLLTNGLWQDASNNIGIGAAPSGTYKFEVTGTAKVSSTLLVSGAATFSSSVTALSGLINGTTDAFFDINRSASGNAGRVRFQTAGTDEFEIGLKGGVAGLHITKGDATELVTVLTSGNVGIGTTSPTAIMQIQGAQAGVSGKNLTISYNGTYYAEYTEKSITAFNNELIIGTGTGGTEKMRITGGGKVTIGSTSLAGDDLFNVTNTSATGYGASIQGGSTSGNYSFVVRKYDGTEYFKVRGDGWLVSASTVNNTSSTAANLGIDGSGNIFKSTASSIRYKENITDWNDNGLDIILTLKPKIFTYKANYYSNPERQFLGLIAEEVAEVSTYLADYENEDKSGQVENVRYANIVVPLIAAIKELSAQNQDLKSRLDKAGL